MSFSGNTDFSAIASERSSTVIGGDISRARTAIFIIRENAETFVWIIDFAGGRFYYDRSQAIIRNAESAAKKLELTAENISELRGAFEKNKVAQWKAFYEGHNGDDTGRLAWALIFELEDGTVQRHGGQGTIDGTPQTYYVMRADLLKFTSKHTRDL